MSTPDFQGIFSQSDGKLGAQNAQLKMQSQRDANNEAFQKAQTALDRRRLALEQKRDEHNRVKDALAEARQKKLDPLQLQRAEQVLKQGEAEIAGLEARTEQAFMAMNLNRAKLISEKAGGVRTQEDVDTLNKSLIKMGILEPGKAPETVAEYRLMGEGSERHLLNLKYEQEARNSTDKLKTKYMFDKAIQDLDNKHQKERQRLGLAGDIQKLVDAHTARTLENEQKAKLGIDKGIVINNAPDQRAPIKKAAQQAGIEQRAMGGPVNAGQPYLVGEQGPEIVVPQQNARVVPNHQLAGQQMASNSMIDPLEEANQYRDNAFARTRARIDEMPSEEELVAERLSNTNRNKIQMEAIAAEENFNNVARLAESFDPAAFTTFDAAEQALASMYERLGGELSPKMAEKVQRRTAFKNNVQGMMLAYRKEITGVAGGEKEMEEIASTTLNMGLGSSQAKGALSKMFRTYLRSRIAKQELLQQGIVPSSNEDPTYTMRFKNKAAQADKQIDLLIEQFKAVNKDQGATTFDALQYFLTTKPQ